MDAEFLKGRGAQKNVPNKFSKEIYSKDFMEGIDEWESEKNKTQFTIVYPKTIVNKVTSPDVGMEYSLNPYQGCEHGCIYCYARNSHQYWGFSAGLDFETKILVKSNAPKLFREFLSKKSWDGSVISLSGNTDCYQPLERKFKLTQCLLKLALEFNQPVSIITKNSLILRDLDILKELAKRNLCIVYISINSLCEQVRRKLEPRTATAKQRLKVMQTLTNNGIPVGIMCAPVIPGLTEHEVPQVIEASSKAGAKWAGFTIVRLNGEISQIFTDWVTKAYPDRASKIINGIKNCHLGQLNDSEFGNRIKGTGKVAEMINHNFKLHCKRHNINTSRFNLDTKKFNNNFNRQLDLFNS